MAIASDAARTSLEDYFRTLVRENERLREIERKHEMLCRAVNENSGECSASCNSYGHAEDCEYVEMAPSLRIQQEKIEALRAALQGTDAEVSRLLSDNERLRATAFSVKELAELCHATGDTKISKGVISYDLRAKLVQMWNEQNRRSLSDETPK
jgi:hypothetical protein